MTKITTIRKPLLLLPLLLILSLAASWAQPGQGYQAMHARLGSGELLDNPQVKEKLGLTDEQISMIKEGIESNKRAQIEHKAQMELLQLDLKKAMDADEIDEKAVADITRKIGELHGKQLENRLKTRAIVQNTLTTEQKEKAKAAMQEKAKEWREKAQERRSERSDDRGAALRQRGVQDDERGPAPAIRGQRQGQRGPAPALRGPQFDRGQRRPAFGPRGDFGPGFGPQAMGLGQGFGGDGNPECLLDGDEPGLQHRGPRAGFAPCPLADEPAEPAEPDMN